MGYFLRSSLPWSGLDAKTQEEKYKRIREKKEEVPLEELCAGFPTEFQKYLKIARDLDFKQRPDYKMLRGLFRTVRDEVGPLQDHQFQWFDGKEFPDPLIALKYPDSLQQPDDNVPTRSFCFCGS